MDFVRPHRTERASSIDRVFDAACDVMLAVQHLEEEAVRRVDGTRSMPATLGVVEETLRALHHTVGELARHAPRTDDEDLRTALAALGTALQEAAGACDVARAAVSARLLRRP